MYSVVSTAIIHGIESIPVFVEADVCDGLPVFEMVGFLAAEVKESKERVRTALRNAGYVLPAKRITVNFSPANIRKSGSGFDIPIAVAVLAAMGVVAPQSLAGTFLIGEMGLNGKTQPVSGILPMVAEAKRQGIGRCIVPPDNVREAGLVSGIEIFAADSLGAVLAILRGEPGGICGPPINIEETGEEHKLDFADIHGQKLLKRACEVAVSGMHNLLMMGPPGAGKTMIAARIPTIMPPLTADEQMELSKIYSVSGLFRKREHLMQERPFRAPHHTITMQGLSGGGVVPKPGEISLAHKGVLFLDELAEFQKNALDVLRQPMEEKTVRLVRLHGSYDFPADFMLVAAMNPCKCGYYPDMQRCRCSAQSVSRYIGKISKPLLDRIDICVEAPQLLFRELNETQAEETSKEIRTRVLETQQLQRERYRGEDFSYNSQITGVKVKEYCCLSQKQEDYMGQIYQKLNLTARSYHKVLKVARTLADLEQSRDISMAHLKEAVCYRSVDRQFWEAARD